jgi:DNA mismatch endonuclease (patch repair protein)
VKTPRAAQLSGRVSRNTEPELRLRHGLHAFGLRFRLHWKVDGCTPDFVLPRWHLAVFVDGCFWHGCPEHGAREFRGPNAERWAEKIRTNRDRDARNDEAVQAAGWRLIRVRECAIRRDAAAAAQQVAEFARSAAHG